MDDIELGCEYEDLVSGFRGICTGRVQYITGCDQALLSSKVDKSYDIKTIWIDIQRLKKVGTKRITLDNGKSRGHDAPAPIK